ncbi:MAG: autotransporter-associated beta strand repeat-containing protein [Prosthecobacter sp.]|uniref:autotransporter-associated beta strand repeat-containing protein n=1 Tax=Prosthecobacter sp. TaxID=1965333 RepID=UPI00390025AD
MTKQPADPAAHTVIIPYDAKLPLEGQKAERFYLGYEEFQRLWKTAKENRRALAAETDATQHAVIHSALYQGRIEERGIVLEARITATTRGQWTKLLLPFAQMVGGKDAAQALVGEVRVDGKAAALNGNWLTLENPGTHAIELTATLPLARDWNDLTLRLPPSLAGMLALRTPKSDGWLRVNEAAASTVEELAEGRLFTQTLGTHREVRLQRSARGLERGEGPVPAANVRATLTLRELEPEDVDAVIEYEFPGAVRRTLEFAVEEKNGLEIGAMNVYTTIPGVGEVRVPTNVTQTRREGGRLIFTISLRHEVSHGAVLKISKATRHLNATGVRQMPLVYPLAQRVKQEVAVLHDDSMKVLVRGGTAQRSANSERGVLLDAGRWQWSSGAAPTYEVTPAALFAEADVGYVFQLSEQKAELLAALTLKRKRGAWTRAVVGLPADYEVQAVQGPALTAWQHEGAQLYLQLDPNIAGMDARIVVHLAKVVPQAVTTWKLEPLKLENYEKVGGKALIVAHAANEVKLPDLTQRSDLKELDATVLDSVFAIAPPLEKKRAVQHEGVAWSLEVALTRQASRFSADTVLLVLASDAGIRVSQQVAATVEQGAIRQISVRLPAALPEAVVSGPLLRETRSRIEGAERVYECSLQTEVLDRAELTFDLDLPLTAELEVPFVKVPGAGRLTRWFVLDNFSAREAKITTQTALEAAAREAVPYLPLGLARPQFFRATGDGALKLAYQQLTSTEGNAALVTLADLTTVLRADGERWDIAQYSLINRSLQFLPVILPEGAELISTSVSGEPVRADEETQGGKRVRLIPLIHTRPGQRALEVKMIYRFAKGPDGLKPGSTLDDPELVGLSVERTTWTVWTPKGWKLDDFDGNMTATVEEGRELQRLEGMLSELGEVNRALSSGKLDYDDAAAAYGDANALAEKVQAKKQEIASKVGRGSLVLSDSRYQQGTMDTEVRQQQELLKGNWDNNYAGKNAMRKGGKDVGQIAQGNTNWGSNKAAPQEQQLRLSGNNTFTGAVTVNGGQLFNDNVAVDNTYFANGAPQLQSAMRGGQVAITNNSIDNLLVSNNGAAAQAAPAQPMAGANGVVKLGAGTLVLNGGTTTYTGETVISGGVVTKSGQRAAMQQNDSSAFQTYSGTATQGAQSLTQNATGSVNIVNSNARSNNLGQMQVDAPQGRTSLATGALGMKDGQEVTLGLATATTAPQRVAGTSSLTISNGSSLTFGGTAAVAAPAAPAMAADPFGAPPAATQPPPPAGKPMELPVSGDGKKQAEAKGERDRDKERGDDKVANLVLAQTVESLRPTGRRALEIELPMDGTAHHFSKLKDHAVLKVEIERLGDARTTSRLLCLTGGLLLWLGVWWWMARQQSRMI